MNNRIVRIVLPIFVIALVFASVRLLNRDESIDSYETEVSSADLSVQARIVEGDKLIEALGGVEQQDFLARDLFVFAKNAYEEYGANENKVVGFKPKNVEKNGDTVELTGKFGSSNHDITITVTLLKNRRISSTIIDQDTGLSFDGNLPSHQKRNLFIGTLPIETKEYVIDYIPNSDGFLINTFNSSENYEAAESAIVSALGLSSIDEENITYYGVGTNTSPYW